MEILELPRNAGKTKALIEKSCKTGFVIITRDTCSADYTLRLAKSMNMEITAPVTYSQVFQRRFDLKNAMIDDLDYFLQVVTRGAVIHMATMREFSEIDCVYQDENL